jgi:hypothetical protein
LPAYVLPSRFLPSKPFHTINQTDRSRIPRSLLFLQPPITLFSVLFPLQTNNTLPHLPQQTHPQHHQQQQQPIMFRRRWSGLPADPVYPSDLKELGFVLLRPPDYPSPAHADPCPHKATSSTKSTRSAPSTTRTTTSSTS